MAEGKWVKSSWSAHAGNCVEVWRKATGCDAGTCVEVAGGEPVAVRDSKDPDGPRLRFPRDQWAAFVAGVKDGEFDLP